MLFWIFTPTLLQSLHPHPPPPSEQLINPTPDPLRTMLIYQRHRNEPIKTTLHDYPAHTCKITYM